MVSVNKKQMTVLRLIYGQREEAHNKRMFSIKLLASSDCIKAQVNQQRSKQALSNIKACQCYFSRLAVSV